MGPLLITWVATWAAHEGVLLGVPEPWAELVWASEGAGPVPAVVGGVSPLTLAMLERRGLVDQRDRPVPFCVLGTPPVVHLRLPDTSSQSLFLGRGKRGDRSLRRFNRGPKVVEGAEAPGLVPETLAGEGPSGPWFLLPGGRVSGPFGTWSVLPTPAIAGSWQVRHGCDLLWEATWSGTLPDGSGTWRVHLACHGEDGPVNLSGHLLAHRTVTGGVGVRWVFPPPHPAVDGPSGLIWPRWRLPGPATEEPQVIRWVTDRWVRGAGAEVVAGERDILRTGGAVPASVRIESGLQTLRVDRHEVLAYGGGDGATLGPGEGRVIRWSAMDGHSAPASPPFVLLRTRVLSDGLVRGRAERLLRAYHELLPKFLGDEIGGPLSDGRHRGDWRFDRSRVGNLEYDSVLGFLNWVRYARSGAAVSSARRGADHLVTVDRDALGSGWFLPHGTDHRSSPAEAGHHWVGGLRQFAAWEPDPIRDPILEEVLGAQIPGLRALSPDRELPRSLGWGLWALVEGAQVSGDIGRRSKSAVVELRARILERQGRSGLLVLGRGSEVTTESPFVQGGILLPALALSLDPCPSAGASRAVERLREAVRTAAFYHPTESDRLVLPRQWTLDPRTGRVLGHHGVAPGEHAALVLAGLHLADPHAPMGGQAEAVRRDLVEDLRSPGKRYPGPEVSLLLRSLPHLLSW